MAIHHYTPLLYDPADFRALWSGAGRNWRDHLRDSTAHHLDPRDAEHLQACLAYCFLAWKVSPVQARTFLVVE